MAFILIISILVYLAGLVKLSTFIADALYVLLFKQRTYIHTSRFSDDKYVGCSSRKEAVLTLVQTLLWPIAYLCYICRVI